jgi:hypothetical protein
MSLSILVWYEVVYSLYRAAVVEEITKKKDEQQESLPATVSGRGGLMGRFFGFSRCETEALARQQLDVDVRILSLVRGARQQGVNSDVVCTICSV